MVCFVKVHVGGTLKMWHRLSRDFFEQNSLNVAQQLIGKTLVFGSVQGIITETEAYCGFDDPASHAARGKTPRNEVMFGLAGVSYVYFIYGMYHCLNIVTEQQDYPAAILIRGVYLQNQHLHLNGPGKLCRYLNITKDHNKIDLTTASDFYLLDTPSLLSWKATPRIGIKQGIEKLWRFVAEID
jgi:DNA-3-methyladenine glycosylase